MSSRNGDALNQVFSRSRRVIAFADLVESVRLMQSNEIEVVDRWRRFVATARDEVLPAHGGRLIRTAGDGLLMDFDTVHGAVDTSFELLRRLSAANHGLTADRVMALRIGVHPAEVFVDQYDAYGAGVNLAARLASLARPGTIVVSDEARQELIDALHADIEDLGLRFLKHVPEPVRCHALKDPSGAAPVSLPLSDEELRPALCIVPFAMRVPDTEHDAIGFALADDLIAALARHPQLRVLSRHSATGFRGAALDPTALRRMHRLLDASYLLSGRYEVRNGRVHLHAELCSLPGGEVQWAGPLSADVADIFAGTDELVSNLVLQVVRQVTAHQLARVRRLPMDTLASYTLFLGATGLMTSLVQRDFQRAHEVLSHLAERHPRQAAPHAHLARWHVFNVVQAWAGDVDRAHRAAMDSARRAIELDPAQPVALSTRALVRLNVELDLNGAIEDNEAAIAADPTEPHAWAQLSGAFSFQGRPAEAVMAASRALAVSPLDPNRYLFESYAAMAAIADGRYPDAVAQARASVRHHALHAPSHRLLVGALWLDGQHDGARAACDRYLHVCPGARATRQPYDRTAPAWQPGFTEALRCAGVPA